MTGCLLDVGERYLFISFLFYVYRYGIVKRIVYFLHLETLENAKLYSIRMKFINMPGSTHHDYVIK